MTREEMMGAQLSPVDISKTYGLLSISEVILSAVLKHTCTSSKATIHINIGTYYVTAINYTNSSSYFWVMDPNFDTNSSCPLPLWNHVPYSGQHGKIDSDSPGHLDLVTQSPYTACFANSSRAVTNNSAYKPVACLSANNSHVYVWVPDYYTGYRYCTVGDLEPYCGYLAMIPFGDWNFFDWPQLQNASYADITKFVRDLLSDFVQISVFPTTRILPQRS